MSKEAYKIIQFMCRELSTCRHFYRGIVEGCYNTAINNYKMPAAVETKDLIVDKVISVLIAK